MEGSTKCIVLNASYEPLSVVSGRRALFLYLKGKAVITEEHPDRFISSVTKKFPIPTQIVLKEYIKSRPAYRQPAQLTQRNLFIRDKYTCQYCGIERKDLPSSQFMTRDHVHPTAKGGKDKWENVVTSCNKCNNKKGSYTMKEAEDFFGMSLQRKPRWPTVFEILSRMEIKYPKG